MAKTSRSEYSTRCYLCFQKTTVRRVKGQWRMLDSSGAPHRCPQAARERAKAERGTQARTDPPDALGPSYGVW